MEMDRSFSPAFELADELKLIWSVKTGNGFFFRASDFITYTLAASQIFAKRRELRWRKLKNAIQIVLKYCLTPVLITSFVTFTAQGLDKRSHGESFLDLFQARFRPDGFYIRR